MGLFNDGLFYLDTTGDGVWNTVAGGDTIRDLYPGGSRSGYQPIIGDWTGSGTDNLGVFNDNYFYLDTTGNGTWDKVAGGDTIHDFYPGGNRNDYTPIAGRWPGFSGVLSIGFTSQSISVPAEEAPIIAAASVGVPTESSLVSQKSTEPPTNVPSVIRYVRDSVNTWTPNWQSVWHTDKIDKIRREVGQKIADKATHVVDSARMHGENFLRHVRDHLSPQEFDVADNLFDSQAADQTEQSDNQASLRDAVFVDLIDVLRLL